MTIKNLKHVLVEDLWPGDVVDTTHLERSSLPWGCRRVVDIREVIAFTNDSVRVEIEFEGGRTAFVCSWQEPVHRVG